MKDIEAYVNGIKVSSEANQVGLDLTANTPECTTFGDSYKQRLGGMLDGSGNIAGFLDFADESLATIEQLRVALEANDTDHVITLSAPDGALAGVAYLFKAKSGGIVLFGQLDEAAPFEFKFDGTGIVTRGQVLYPDTATASSADGTGVQVGAASATETVNATLHVLSGTGTLDVIIESDATNAWIGAETTRITFAQNTGGADHEYASVAGPVTDPWWRISSTIVTGPFTFFVALGVA